MAVEIDRVTFAIAAIRNMVGSSGLGYVHWWGDCIHAFHIQLAASAGTDIEGNCAPRRKPPTNRCAVLRGAMVNQSHRRALAKGNPIQAPRVFGEKLSLRYSRSSLIHRADRDRHSDLGIRRYGEQETAAQAFLSPCIWEVPRICCAGSTDRFTFQVRENWAYRFFAINNAINRRACKRVFSQRPRSQVGLKPRVLLVRHRD